MGVPAWWTKKNQKEKSQRKERRTARDLGGRTQPASGATAFAKGDIKTSRFLIEHKMTERKSYSLTMETLSKIEREASAVAKLPAMVIEIQSRRYIVMRYEDVT